MNISELKIFYKKNLTCISLKHNLQKQLIIKGIQYVMFSMKLQFLHYKNNDQSWEFSTDV